MTKTELTDWSDWLPEINPTDLKPEDFEKIIIEPPYFPIPEIPQGTDDKD